MLVEWESFKGYLIDERGFTESSANIYVYKSRFTAITKYFAERPFTKENIRLYIHHIATNVKHSKRGRTSLTVERTALLT